jgi:hypothetical protein
MEELFQIILQWCPCQQQFVIYLVAIKDSKKLKDGTRTNRRKGYQRQVVDPPQWIYCSFIRTRAQISHIWESYSPWTGCS